MTQIASSPPATADPESKKYGVGWRIAATGLLVFSLLGIGGAMLGEILTAPAFMKAAQAMGYEVGSLTRTTFAVSKFCYDYWFLAIGGYVVLFGVLMILAWSRRITGKSSLLVAVVCTMVSAFVVIMAALGIIFALQEIAHVAPAGGVS